MAGAPAVQFAPSADGWLAFQEWGAGPCTLVVVPPMAQNIELTWERPEFRSMFERMGSFARCVHYDKRGTGASDRTGGVPTLDERLAETLAVMAAAGVERAFVLGLSEGGLLAVLLAMAVPERVDGLIVHSSSARWPFFDVDQEPPEEVAARAEMADAWIRGWGTEGSTTLEWFAPSVAADPGYRSWQPRYERQSASPTALRELLAMTEDVDVRALLPSLDVPTLVLHRRDDRVVPVWRGRELAALVPGARFVELEGSDHHPQVGDVGAWVDEVATFMTGRPPVVAGPSPATHHRTIRTMGGFEVVVDGAPVPLDRWGSRKARQLCKRLAVAAGMPVTRDELFDLLWPDEADRARLGARLSVLLSHVRRVLRGGVIADRVAVRLDVSAIDIDVAVLRVALADGDDERAIAVHRGELLPEDRFEDWTCAPRDGVRTAVIDAHRRLLTSAIQTGELDIAAGHAEAILVLDRFDERAHEALVRSLTAAGLAGQARRAEGRYRSAMAELGVTPRVVSD